MSDSSNIDSSEDGDVFIPVEEGQMVLVESTNSSESDEEEEPEENEPECQESSEDEVAEEDLPPVREHSYLPGASHPLHIPEDQRQLPSTTDIKVEQKDTGLIELAVLELPDVVLFPGSTLPIRLGHTDWIRYLGPKIDASRALEGRHVEQVRLGVLCLPSLPGEASVLPGVSPRRQSWTRRGFGPARLRRLSERLRQELERGMEDVEEDGDRGEGGGGADPQRPSGRGSAPPPPPPPPPRHDDETSERDTQRRRRSSYIGRIGTIATVVFTHGDDVMNLPSQVWRSHQGGQLVLTALGTGRFRIVAALQDQEEEGGNRARSVWRSSIPGGVKKFSVEELHDEPLAFPPNGRFAGPCTGTSAKKRHEEVIRHLALVSPIPEAVYKKVWPWRLAALIREGIERISTFDGLTQTLQQLDDPRDKLNPLLDPGSFSFWMASNLPLKQEERLDLLEMISPVERLQFIHRKVLEEERAQTEIRCKECGSPLAHATDMFTVGGAEGTTGNYVNEYGSVHQTITLREIDEREVTYVGRPESRDSWFPGYSWTIMQCGFCNSHLGWKFDRLGKRRTGEISRDRPGKFYGVSAGNVSTATSSRGNRRDMTLED